jgi:hypothetical protein
VVNAGATLLVIVALAMDKPLPMSEAAAVGLFAAFIGTVVMEYG